MIDKFKDAFKIEALDLLNQLETTLLELEENPGDPELISGAFRAMHTIKGSAAMFGFDRISGFTHELENALDLIRSGRIGIDKEFIDIGLAARDHIKQLLEDPGEDPALEASSSALVGRVGAFLHSRLAAADRAESQRMEAEARSSGVPPARGRAEGLGSAVDPGAGEGGGAGPAARADPEQAASAEAAAGADAELMVETFRIRFAPHADIFANGTKPLLLLAELGGLGELTTTPFLEAVPELSALDAERCHAGFECILSTSRGLNAVRDVFIFVENDCDLEIVKIGDEGEARDRGRVKKLGEILVERGIATAEKVAAAVKSQRRLGEVLVEEKVASASQIRTALAEQEHLKLLRERQQQDLSTSSIRVSSEKLDDLVDLVGELVTLQARLAQTAAIAKEAGLESISEQFERLISQLRDNTMSIRMLPIGSTFSKFKRVVRDLSIEVGKDAELLTEGADTELDKTVIEKLGDPLVHIIRNSVDHGIEAPGDRERAGKPRKGTILLSAQHSGAFVLIKVADDGAGLDREAIRAKAVERGMIGAHVELSDEDIHQLIFEPGFSTASEVTSVSGRGVGMDVVKRQIDSLGGQVIIETARGKGTSITLKIPLTLAIIDGLLVRIGAEFYVIPLGMVDGCLEIEAAKKAGALERALLSYRGEALPYASLRAQFEVPGEGPAIEQVVVCNALESRVGFVVDAVIGDYQTVIKPLGRMYRNVEGLSGATILGDGVVALIIDVNKLASIVQRDELGKARRAGAR